MYVFFLSRTSVKGLNNAVILASLFHHKFPKKRILSVTDILLISIYSSEIVFLFFFLQREQILIVSV